MATICNWGKIVSYIYADADTQKFAFIANSPRKDENLILVKSVPEHKNQLWDGNQWIEPPAEALKADAELKIVILSEYDDLAVGNDPNEIADLDILYYKNTAPKKSGDGIYLNSKGYLIFPQLVSHIEQEKSINFVFYSGNSTNYLVFGYCSQEQFNFASNDYTKAELGLRFRNKYGCYYQHGRFESGNGSTSFMGYVDFDHQYAYRLEIPIKGESAILTRLEGTTPDRWLAGKKQQTIPLSTAPDLVGNTLYPYFGNYNGDKCPILGVFTTN